MSTAAAPSQPSAQPGGWRLGHTYATLPPLLHRRCQPEPVRAPRLVILNRPLARELGLDPDALSGVDGAAWFAGNALPPGAKPLAQAYAGHQYGHFTGLGDGRALLLGEQVTPDGRRFDVQLKGSGRTPFSRSGDGRAALGPMLREYVVSEAMHALGIPTTRSLAVVATGETILRQEGPLPGAVLVRVAASHIRVGTCEWAAAHREPGVLRALVDHVLHRHFPEREGGSNPALALLEAVVSRQARLLARWMHVGFVHGVMNTDNMALSGETIDYGPCAFLDVFDPARAFSSIDRHGRYAYGNQPAIAQWNLARLGEALLHLLDPAEERALELANAAVGAFGAQYDAAWLEGARGKLGLLDAEDGDRALAEDLLRWMAHTRADFTNTFRALSTLPSPETRAFDDADFEAWHTRWVARLEGAGRPWADVRERMQMHNPAVIPRNHIVEDVLARATGGDTAPLGELLRVLARPFDHATRVPTWYLQPAPAGAPPYRTFCGT